RSGKKLALKKMPHVFQNMCACRRVYREISMLNSFQHDNVIGLVDVIRPQNPNFFQEISVFTELMETDLHKIIVSPQELTVEHVKLFVYQILRGLKYLHSAHILHRDIKPANLLVNSDCCLKICDFGLARVWDEKENAEMTHEVVTQYYRAPELLMGARIYTDAIDVWSVGCIFAELMDRNILFQAPGPLDQLDKIIDLVGTPSTEDMVLACDGARAHVLQLPIKRVDTRASFSKITKDDLAIDLLSRLLAFNPDQRIDVSEALHHPFLSDGRLRFHSLMCSCCSTNDNQRIFCNDLEPVHSAPFDPRWEQELARLTLFDQRDRLYNFAAN
ncbi:hypothetical protein PMAYCL1PPCAC_27772, partial [Pristionchus mayeri]